MRFWIAHGWPLVTAVVSGLRVALALATKLCLKAWSLAIMRQLLARKVTWLAVERARGKSEYLDPQRLRNLHMYWLGCGRPRSTIVRRRPMLRCMWRWYRAPPSWGGRAVGASIYMILVLGCRSMAWVSVSVVRFQAGSSRMMSNGGVGGWGDLLVMGGATSPSVGHHRIKRRRSMGGMGLRAERRGALAGHGGVGVVSGVWMCREIVLVESESPHLVLGCDPRAPVCEAPRWTWRKGMGGHQRGKGETRRPRWWSTL